MANEAVRPGELDDDLVREWNQMRALVNELKTVQATNRTLLNELKTIQATNRTAINELKADHNALLAKLDLDAGVTDTDYAATVAVAAADIAAVSGADVAAVAGADVDSFSLNW